MLRSAGMRRTVRGWFLRPVQYFGQPPKESFFYFNNYDAFFCFVSRGSFFSFVVLNYCFILVYSDLLSFARFVVSATARVSLHPNEMGGV
jgi:hypothetical protein